jgi:hypothetical protein
MKPRLYLSSWGDWICECELVQSYLGTGESAADAYNMWAWKNRIFGWFDDYALLCPSAIIPPSQPHRTSTSPGQRNEQAERHSQ